LNFGTDRGVKRVMLPPTSCSALIATRDRWAELIDGALPAIRRQSHAPEQVVVVNDGVPFSRDQETELRNLLDPLRATVLQNRRAGGAAGAWNTGLEYLLSGSDDGFVALLDDDDDWDATHLEENLRAAERARADAVVSGLRLLVDGREIERPLPTALSPTEFLVGNPGWQGSNTFMSRRLWRAVGGFRDGLKSLNDRDLAIRALRIPWVRVAYTGAFTSSWNVTTGRDALSAPRSPAKISGLRWFWQIYGGEMSESDANAFFARADRLFAVSREEITAAAGDAPPHRHPRGDLHASR
jgi:glycosyltransferase involved in cell wall biosynthesis